MTRGTKRLVEVLRHYSLENYFLLGPGDFLFSETNYMLFHSVATVL